ncbi:MAG: 7TM diverse intracellular signaling domain-containing protein [Chitinophagaceae bacterium]
MVLQKQIALLIFILLPVINYAQSVIINDTTVPPYIFINKFTSSLQTTELIPFDSILQASSQKKFLATENTPVIFKGYTPYYYWYRFVISNHTRSTKNFILLLGGLGIRSSETWQGKNKNWISLGKSGYQYPFAKRPYAYVHHAFPVCVAGLNTDTFYITVNDSHTYKVESFVLAEPGYMKKFEHRFYFSFGIITGLLFLFAILNLYLYFSVKEKIHLYYCLYTAAMLFFLLKNEGLDGEFLGLDSAVGYRSTCMAGVAGLAVGLLLHVVQLFLINLRKAGILFKALSFMKWFIFIAAIIQFIVFYMQPANIIEWFVYEVANKTGLLAFPLILISCIYSTLKGYKPALFLLAGITLFLAGGIARSLFIGAKGFIFPPSLFEIGLVAEVFIISFGLMYRYNQYKKEKEHFKKELELQQIEVGKQLLLTQEAEQKRIAQDLHDELGGSLGALKMTLQSFNLPDEQANTLNRLVDTASSNTRNIAHNLMPPEFENTSLEELLDKFYQRVNTEGVINFHFLSTGTTHRLNKQDELIIYRIIMELTNNIIKHAGATEATIQLIYYETYLELMAEDNGKGFAEKKSDGIGLKSIKSRIDYLRGKLNIDSANRGTTIMIQVPYKTT